MNVPPRPAPEWEIARWLNTDQPLGLAALRGRVIVAAAFQMLCPGCVEYTIPQLGRVREAFSPDEVAVVGLHTVFEHHEAMGPAALSAFLYEYKVAFPVGIDRPGEDGDPLPRTMQRYRMRGTPTVLLIDREGMLRNQTFGHIPDLQMGAEIMALVREPKLAPLALGGLDVLPKGAHAPVCGPDGCEIPPSPPARADAAASRKGEVS